MNWQAHLRTVLGAGVFVLAGCGGKDASTLTHPSRKLGFPMYASIPGLTAGSGAVYRIDAPGSTDATSTVTAIAQDLNFPSAVAVARDGTLYYAERPAAETGRVMRYLGPDQEPELVADNLADPQGDRKSTRLNSSH